MINCYRAPNLLSINPKILDKNLNPKSPKTRMDLDFLRVVEEIMPHLQVSSDRAMSKVLGQHENFLSRIRTGIQSVPSSVWDTLYELFNSRELRHLGYSRPKLRVKYRPIGADELIPEKIALPGDETGAGRKRTIASYEKDLAAAHEKISLLTSLLEEKERTIQILLNQSTNQ